MMMLISVNRKELPSLVLAVEKEERGKEERREDG
jgi:hypothetical protein